MKEGTFFREQGGTTHRWGERWISVTAKSIEDAKSIGEAMRKVRRSSLTSSSYDLLTKEECFKILKLYENWNVGQHSVSYALNGVRTTEDDIYDERRILLRAVQRRLQELT